MQRIQPLIADDVEQDGVDLPMPDGVGQIWMQDVIVPFAICADAGIF